MATLNWIGKNAVVNHDKEVPFKLLKKIKSASVGTSRNLIVHGDNLEALKALMPHYQGKVKCIYIDPPYNTGNEGWIYNDRVNSPKIRQWLGKVVGGQSEDLNRHDKWLCMMYPRLKLLRDLLAEDGFIFISVDENEHCNLRGAMDEIFLEENHITTITWQRKKESSNDSRNITVKAEYILVYARSKVAQLNLLSLSEAYIETAYKSPNKEFPHGKWRPVPIATTKGHKSGGYTYEITTPSGKKHKREWAYPEESYKRLVAEGKIYFGIKGDGVPQRVIYAHESTGIPASNIWVDVATNKEGKNEIVNLFDDGIFETPKPVGLIKRILELASNKDSIVLDSFAGSGTTGHAVLELNKQDGGNRKFVLIEMEDEVAKKITAERIKRAIKKFGYSDGFEYCELDKPLFNEHGQIEETCDFDQLASYIYFTETQTNIDSAKVKGNYIGENESTEYYLIYKEPHKNDMDKSFLKKLSKTDLKKVVYADRCTLDETDLAEYNLVFKQIPYEVKVF